jgi:PhnB protein
MSVKIIPPGHHTVSPYLAIKDAVKALEFYKIAFGATESYKLMMPDGRLGHAEIRLGDSVIMLSYEFPEFGGKAPQTLGGSPVSIHVGSRSHSEIRINELGEGRSLYMTILSGG